MFRRIVWSVAGSVLLLSANAHADETACVVGREKAAGQYALCQSKAKEPFFHDPFAFVKCRSKYASAWAKLVTKNPGTSCAGPRFVDNADGTVTDQLTGLVWEKKDHLGGVHDVGARYVWTDVDSDVTDGDGTVFTDFLANLNAGAGFAGSNDWRLPTIQELQTILIPGSVFPCVTSPCTVPELGPDAESGYWSATTYLYDLESAWVIDSQSGNVQPNAKNGDGPVRAVRAGF